MSAAVQLINVSKMIKRRTVLKEISISVSTGSITGFVGHNGSGKSMLFRVVTGLVRPTSGSVIVNGEKLHEQISFPQNTSVILEKPGFIESYSGYDNLKYLADIQRKIDSERIKQTIQRVGLDPNDLRPVKTYSLGMKQKLAIAQAIMEEPDLILLDEPMNGLDEDSVANVYNIIKEENKRGATILLTSHHKVDIETLCDNVYKLNDGSIVQ